MSDGTGEVSFTHAGGPGDKHVEMVFDEAAVGEFADACFIEATPRVEVEVFKGSLEFQFSPTQTIGELSIGPQGVLAIDEEGETVVEAQCVDVAVVELLLEGLCHAG